ncbi:MAG TPA: hypothetical protein VM911_15800 [Pyrinomonadaceae bacterium]|jgi:uncharacterized protein (TIGR03437 family)|nr:hypothetical protein [Pyrinomonadaceae bacterium]
MMFITRLCLSVCALLLALIFVAYLWACIASAQGSPVDENLKPDVEGARSARPRDADLKKRPGGYESTGMKATVTRPPLRLSSEASRARTPARAASLKNTAASSVNEIGNAADIISSRIGAGTPLSRVLHTSQLGINTNAGSDEGFFDRTLDLVADERTTFDSSGGSFDLAVGSTGARYEVYSAIDDRGTSTSSDDLPTGVLVVALDTNGDYVRDQASTFNLRRDFQLPSLVAVVSGTSRAGQEFVVVSSSGYYNYDNPSDPRNEPTAGVVLLLRDPSGGGFDASRSRELVRAGSGQLNNANALALLPNNDLLIADFDSNELRIVRDTNADGIPDTLDAVPYYSYRFSNDAPLDIAVNSRGVVFSHSFGNDTVLLALYDDNSDGRADRDEVVVEGLSLDNNFILHGLTVDRAGTVYIIEDASGAADLFSLGGNLGTPRIDAFTDPALNGFLRDGAVYAVVDNPSTQMLTGLAFGVDTTFGPVGHLTLVNSASLRAPATYSGLATIKGVGLTRGLRAATEAEALASGVRVTVEGRTVPVLTFNDSHVNIYLPEAVGAGVRSVVVSVGPNVTAADDQSVSRDNPGLFTVQQTGSGEAVALLASGLRYTAGPFPATWDGQPSVIALFGTGWGNSLPLTVRINGQSAVVEYAGPSGGFPGLDQINVRIPSGTSGAASVVVTTASGAASRNGVVVSIN